MFEKLFCFLLLGSVLGQSDDVCLSLRRPEGNSPEIRQGYPGKRGPAGPPGPRGIQGETGECECDISDVLEQVRVMNETIRELENEKRIRTDKCYGGLVYNNSCIKLAYIRGVLVTYPEALAICEGSLAEILSDDMHVAMYDYVRRTWIEDTNIPSRDFIETWLGSTYETRNYPERSVRLTNGEKASLSFWHRGYPSSSSSNTQMQFRVNTRIEGPYRDLFSYPPGGRTGVPLCSYEL